MRKFEMMRKPAILILGISCLFILVVTGYEIIKISDENRKELLDRDSSKILQDINYIAFSKAEEATRALAANEFVKQLCLKKDPINYDKAITILNTVHVISNIELCYIMDSNGVVIASSEYAIDKNIKIKGQNYSFRPYFFEALSGNDVIYPALGSTTGLRGIYFSSPVKGNDNSAIGVVTCKISMDLIDKILKEYPHKALISTVDGIVFSTNTEDWLYMSILPISDQKLASIIKSRQFLNVLIKPLDLSIKDNTSILDYKKYYTSKKSIGKTGWTLIILSNFRGQYLLMPMQLRFITIIFVILIVLMITIVLLINNIFKRRESESILKKLFHAVQQSSSTLVITDINGIIEYVNPKFTELTGYSINEAVGKNTNILKSNEHDSEFYKKMWTTILSGEDWRGNFCNRRKNGEIYWEEDIISSVKNDKGKITNFIAFKEDITKRRELYEKLNIYATMDEMTGAFNRRTGMLLMEKQLQVSKRQNQHFIIFFMDINGLKSVNDTLGHSSGDELITLAIESIKNGLRESDSVCRLGGDEFLVILPDTKLSQAEVILNRIEDEIEKINSKEMYPYILSLSFGTAEYWPESELTVDDMIHIADDKMYKNKAETKQKQGYKGIFR